MFVERAIDAKRLEMLLDENGARVLTVLGAPGTGKTTLAMMFAQTHESEFPGGVFHIYADPDIDRLLSEIENLVGPAREKHLIILDNAEAIPSVRLSVELKQLSQRRENSRILILTRPSAGVPDIGEVVDLGGLSPFSARNLFLRLGVSLEPDEANSLAQKLGGDPKAMQSAADLLRSGKYTAAELLTNLQPFQQSGIVDVKGHPLSSGKNYDTIISAVSEVSDELLKAVSRDPSTLYGLSARKFEEFTAELLSRQGFQVKLTPFSKDGGKDIYVAVNNLVGSFMYLVECKRYGPENTVGIDLVQRLHGVVQAERATAGIFVTTSSFTAPAMKFQSLIPYQLSLVDYAGIQNWLRAALEK